MDAGRNVVTIEMSALEAHKVLAELEYAMSFANRSGKAARESWYLIACQLKGGSLEEARDLAHQREQEYQAERAAEQRAKEEEEAANQPWYRRLIG